MYLSSYKGCKKVLPMGVTDFKVLETSGFFWGWFDAFWEVGVRPTDGASAAGDVPARRGEVSGEVPDAHVLAPRPVSVHGVRPTDLPGKPARHRNLSAGRLYAEDSFGVEL
jgi:hypothetical protein